MNTRRKLSKKPISKKSKLVGLEELFSLQSQQPSKDDLYYEAMDLCGSDKSAAKKALKLLKTALKQDPNYVQTHVGLVSVYSILGDKKELDVAIETAYQKTLKMFPKWPKQLEWGFLENRAPLRAVQYMADLYWDHGEQDKAIELFRLLLRLNPNDNQGVRYEISALYAGLTGEEINRMFDEGNEKQDWSKLEGLVKIQNAKHKFWKEPKYD